MRVERIHPKAKLPVRGSEGAAGLDLYACEEVVIPPGETRAVSLGIKCEIPRLHVAFFKDRSSLGLQGLTVLAGVIDCDYRGEWKVVLHNTRRLTLWERLKAYFFPLTEKDFIVEVGDRITQAVIMPYWTGPIIEGRVGETVRGANSFGSTGR